MRTCELFLRYTTPSGDKYESLDAILAFGNKNIHKGYHDGIVYEQFGDLYFPAKHQAHLKDIKNERDRGHDLVFERSSGYAGCRCTKCGEWYSSRVVTWRELPPCKQTK